MTDREKYPYLPVGVKDGEEVVSYRLINPLNGNVVSISVEEYNLHFSKFDSSKVVNVYSKILAENIEKIREIVCQEMYKRIGDWILNLGTEKEAYRSVVNEVVKNCIVEFPRRRLEKKSKFISAKAFHEQTKNLIGSAGPMFLYGELFKGDKWSNRKDVEIMRLKSDLTICVLNRLWPEEPERLESAKGDLIKQVLLMSGSLNDGGKWKHGTRKKYILRALYNALVGEDLLFGIKIAVFVRYLREKIGAKISEKSLRTPRTTEAGREDDREKELEFKAIIKKIRGHNFRPEV